MIIRPSARPVDRFGAPIDPGDLIAYTPSVPLIAKVTDIRRGSTADPPGTCYVTLSIDLTIPAKSDSPTPGWIRIGYLSDQGPVIGSPIRGSQPADSPAPPAPDVQTPPTDPPTVPAGPHLVT